MCKRSTLLCLFLMGLAVLSVVGKEEKGTKKKVKEASGDPYWCGPRLEEVCYEGDSKEEKDYNFDDSVKDPKDNNNDKPKDNKPNEAKKTPATKTPSDNSICNKDFDSGPCFSSMPKYYYRTETKRCEMFVYGGCGGNENRFDTQKACQEKCGGG
ncbi:uncharacterized protein LOC119179801 [Rhipicephalus microplus]|uniref:uncharacterized protein LOC119179801 n=1 Tax=Rhipicephalus microplus TaxID=6941 RepID=UPI003F6D5EF2